MANKPNITWHARTDNERSLCGLNPKQGHYNIARFCSFFTALPEDQCAKCIELIKKHGYNIEQLRLKYRAVYDHAQEIDKGEAGQSMTPYLEQARTIIRHQA